MKDPLLKNSPLNNPETTDAPLIILDHIHFWYEDIPALDDISLRIAKGSVVAFSGPNGCGKSTLFRLLNGLIFAGKGTYHFNGNLINKISMKDQIFAKSLHQQLGFVFQNPDTQLFCPSVREEVSFGLRQMALTDEEIELRTDEILDLFGLSHLQMRAPYHLSGGEKRKVSIACIVAMNPEALIFDEPTNGLDEDSQAWFIEFIASLAQSGKTIIIATHHKQVIQSLNAYEYHLDKNHHLITP